MTPDQAAAYVNAQTALMLVELAAMHAKNAERAIQDHSPAYGEDAFTALSNRYGHISHNGVLTLFQDANR